MTSRMRAVLKSIAYALLVILLLILFVTKLIGYIAPFLVALVITLIIERPVRFLEKKSKFPRGAAVATSLVFFVTIVGGTLTFVFYKIINELWKLALELSKIDVDPIVDYFESLVEQGQILFASLPDGLVKVIQESMQQNLPDLSSLLRGISSQLMGWVNTMISVAKSLPQVFIFIMISLVATYFMSRDRQKISVFLYKQVPLSWAEKFRGVKRDMLIALIGFLKAQLFLTGVTFLELLIGYLILEVPYAFFFALLTALVDAIPVLGTGTILIPAGVFYLLSGDIARGLSFIMLYLVIMIIRQFLEPRVIGQSIGLHPLATLMGMYIGLKLFGILGMIIGPIMIIILKAFQKAQIFPAWKK